MKKNIKSKTVAPLPARKELPKPLIISFALECYKLYPRKLGKFHGIKKLTVGSKRLKTEDDCRDFFRALHNFFEYHRTRGTEQEYIPYFSSFVTSWMDWLDDDVGKTIEFKKPEKDLFANIPGGESSERGENEPGSIPGSDERSSPVLRRPKKL